jgi:hypothetical protein
MTALFNLSNGRRPHHQGIHVYAIDADADEIAVEAVESSGENHVDTTEDTYCRRLYVHYFLLILILLLLHFTHAFLYSFVDGTAFKNRGTQESASCMSSWKVPLVPVNLLPLYAVSWHGCLKAVTRRARIPKIERCNAALQLPVNNCIAPLVCDPSNYFYPTDGLGLDQSGLSSGLLTFSGH